MNEVVQQSAIGYGGGIFCPYFFERQRFKDYTQVLFNEFGELPPHVNLFLVDDLPEVLWPDDGREWLCGCQPWNWTNKTYGPALVFLPHLSRLNHSAAKSLHFFKSLPRMPGMSQDLSRDQLKPAQFDVDVFT
jgi:hypothetical protein